jgi:predicted  nucleic acid-binding Zn-ribbon protein
LDLSTLWRKQHDDLHSTLEKERDAIFVVQNEKEALQAQMTELQARLKPGRKRKSAEQEGPEATKKMKAGTLAIAEFGCAADVDPGLT